MNRTNMRLMFIIFTLITLSGCVGYSSGYGRYPMQQGSRYGAQYPQSQYGGNYYGQTPYGNYSPMPYGNIGYGNYGQTPYGNNGYGNNQGYQPN